MDAATARFHDPIDILVDGRDAMDLRGDLHFVDLNGNGRSDLLKVDDGLELTVAMNDHPNGFQEFGPLYFSGYPYAANTFRTVDIDHDDRLEVVVQNGSGLLSVIDVDGAPSLTTYALATQEIRGRITEIDIDRDGTNEFFFQVIPLILDTFEPRPCDFNGSGECDFTDLDLLLYNGQVNQDLTYDLDQSGTVDLADRDAFLVGSDSLPGDFNGDGFVDRPGPQRRWYPLANRG